MTAFHCISFTNAKSAVAGGNAEGLIALTSFALSPSPTAL